MSGRTKVPGHYCSTSESSHRGYAPATLRRVRGSDGGPNSRWPWLGVEPPGCSDRRMSGLGRRPSEDRRVKNWQLRRRGGTAAPRAAAGRALTPNRDPCPAHRRLDDVHPWGPRGPQPPRTGRLGHAILPVPTIPPYARPSLRAVGGRPLPRLPSRYGPLLELMRSRDLVPCSTSGHRGRSSRKDLASLIDCARVTDLIGAISSKSFGRISAGDDELD